MGAETAMLSGLLAGLGLVAVWLFARNRGMRAPAPGEPAPDFALADAGGGERRLADYRGAWLVLYFYPRDDTPGCTVEACALRDAWAEFAARDVAVLGLSLDPPGRHARFAAKHGLPFPLLSDPGGRVARRYAALLDLGVVRFARRHSYLIDPAGRVARRFAPVSPRRHARDILAALDEILLEGGAGVSNNPDMPLR